jgi:hypothetical protein
VQDGRPTRRTEIVRVLRQALELPVAGEQVRASFRLLDGGRAD